MLMAAKSSMIGHNGGPSIDDVFDTTLWTGNGASRTIATSVDTFTFGGLHWVKRRSVDSGTNSGYHALYVPKIQSTSLCTNNSGINAPGMGLTVSAPNAFNLGTGNYLNANTQPFVGWSLRNAPRFFQAVSYTGNGAARTIAHNLEVAPGFMMLHASDNSGVWALYHKGITNSRRNYITLGASSVTTSTTIFNDTDPTGTVFSLGNSAFNTNGVPYIALLFADDPTGLITCGSFSGNATVDLGWEPQFLWMWGTTVGVWADYMVDTTRGFPTGSSTCNYIKASNDNAETSGAVAQRSSTGFTAAAGTGTWQYIAVRKS